MGVSVGPCLTPQAHYLLHALLDSLESDQGSAPLGRAARSWGARFSAPADVLTYLSALRTVLAEQQAVAAVATPSPAGEGPPPLHPAEAARRVAALIDQVSREAVDAAAANLRAAARTDPLTGCANRLALNEDLARATFMAAEDGVDLAIAMIDLDGLKQINDSHGHEAGDAALVGLAGTLRQVLRASDSLYRIGGDEFVVVAPFTSAEGAESMLRRAMALDGPSFSWGVASLATVGPEALAQPSLLVAAADAALYDSRARRRSTTTSLALPATSVAAGAAAAVGPAAADDSSTVMPGAAAAPSNDAAGAPSGAQAPDPPYRQRRVRGRGASTSAGLGTVAAVLLVVIGALSVALSLESDSTPGVGSALTGNGGGAPVPFAIGSGSAGHHHHTSTTGRAPTASRLTGRRGATGGSAPERAGSAGAAPGARPRRTSGSGAGAGSGARTSSAPAGSTHGGSSPSPQGGSPVAGSGSGTGAVLDIAPVPPAAIGQPAAAPRPVPGPPGPAAPAPHRHHGPASGHPARPGPAGHGLRARQPAGHRSSRGRPRGLRHHGRGGRRRGHHGGR
ncbi:MAG TPA: GGDEF domain-containing protein [Acidimicrobiales bacterium]|nr:GGDEF domain-containing protein [Acidimicrobiales bacterium]